MRTVNLPNELTPAEAADVLNVARDYLLRLVDEGRISVHGAGDERGLHLVDVLAYKERRDAARRAGLAELTRLTQEAGGYDRELK